MSTTRSPAARWSMQLQRWPAVRARVVGVCSGAFLLAAAGLLAGRRATTHWARARRLAAEHPGVEVDASPIWVRDGDVWTSAGVTAGIDLALALVEDDHGVDVAETVARWLVVFLRRPGTQSQFAAPVWRRRARHEPVRQAQDLIDADPAGDHRLARPGIAGGDQRAPPAAAVLRRARCDPGPLRRRRPRRGGPPPARGLRRDRRRDRRVRRLRDRRVDAPHVRPPPRDAARRLPPPLLQTTEGAHDHHCVPRPRRPLLAAPSLALGRSHLERHHA